MEISSFDQDLEFGDTIKTRLILESSFSKEIRIVLRKGQIMKEHKTPFPIIVHIIDGEINFGVNGTTYQLKKGGILALDGNVPHDLTAKANSIVRLTLSKSDKLERVEKVAISSSN
ncbi:MAG: cupin domain-containing protein [Balneola sp.]